MAGEVSIASNVSSNVSNAIRVAMPGAARLRERAGSSVLSDSSVKLKMSDLHFKSSPDNEGRESTGVPMTRWDIPNVAYKSDGTTRNAYATITQYLDRQNGSVAGYEGFFDKAGASVTGKTLQETKRKLLKHINTLRG